MRKNLLWIPMVLGVALSGCGEENTTPPPAAPPATPPSAPLVPAAKPSTTTPPPPTVVASPELTPLDVRGRIALSRETLDLGPIPEGAEYTGSITILNGLKTEVEIRRVAGECSCVKWDFHGFKKIQLLGSLTVPFTLKSAPQYSRKKIPVEVITSSNVTPRLEAVITYECVPAPKTEAAPDAASQPAVAPLPPVVK